MSIKALRPLVMCLTLCVAQATPPEAEHTAPAAAQAIQETEELRQEQAAEPPVNLPDWKEEDMAELMKGTWWDRVTPLLPVMVEDTVPAASMPTPDADSPAVDLIPEDYDNVNEYFLPAYIRNDCGLIDPQKLLTEVESQDVLALIDLIRDVYKVNLYVSVFAGGQKVPASVNAPAVSRQIFEEGKRNLLLHYHVGDIKNTQVALDPDLSAKLGDTGRRDLLYRIKKDAAVYAHPQDELLAAMVSLVEMTREDLISAPPPAAPDLSAPERVEVPKVSLQIDKPQPSNDDSVREMFKEWGMYAEAHAMGITAAVVTVVLLLSVWWLWRRSSVVRLLPSEPDRRLGAPNGASQSRAVNYRTQERNK